MLKIILITLIASFLCSMPIAAKEDAIAINGTLDLSAWDFTSDDLINLDGQWLFYWQQFIDPQQTPTSRTDSITVPSSWKNHTLNNGEVLPGHGHASYQLTVLLPSDTPQLAININDIGEADKLYINGELYHEAGKLGVDEGASQPGFNSDILILPENIDNTLNIVAHVSNYNYHKGGIWAPLTLGNVKAINNSHTLTIAYDIFSIGALSMVVLHYFSIYLLRRKDITSLFFSLGCAAVLLRVLTTNERLLADLMPSLL